MVGFPKRRFDGFNAVPYWHMRNGQYPDDQFATQLMVNGLNAHAHALRIQGQALGNAPADGATVYLERDVVRGMPVGLWRQKLDQIITGAGGRLRIWINCRRADGASTLWIAAQTGRVWSGKTYITAAAATDGWYLIELPLEPIKSPLLYNDMTLDIIAGVDYDYSSTETIQVTTIDVYEGWKRNARPWRDTTGANNKLGEPDYPYSPGMERVFGDKLDFAHNSRMGRCNIFHRCFMTALQAIGAGYGANYDRLGKWRFRKPAGFTQIDGKTYGWGVTPLGQITIRLSIYSVDSLNYDNEVANFTAGATLIGQTSGARATIVSVNDLGVTGTLALSDVEGAFQNNEQIVDSEGGDALANGTLAGPYALANSTVVVTGAAGTNLWADFPIAGFISGEAEYEARLDAIRSGAGASTEALIPIFFIAPHIGTDVTHQLPNPVHTEQDDDVRASTWRNLRDTLDFIYARRGDILVSDHRWESGGQITGQAISYGGDLKDPTKGTFGYGVAFPSQGARVLRCRARVSRPSHEKTFKLDIDNIVGGPPAAGDVLTGGTNSATANVVSASIVGAAGTVTLEATDGFFFDNEALAFAGSGATAIANGTLYRFEGNLKLRLATIYATAAGLVYTTHEIDCSRINRTAVTEVELRIFISPEYWNDLTTHNPAAGIYGPYVWSVDAKTDDLGDYLILHKLEVFEQPLFPGGWEMSEEELQ